MLSSVLQKNGYFRLPLGKQVQMKNLIAWPFKFCLALLVFLTVGATAHANVQGYARCDGIHIPPQGTQIGYDGGSAPKRGVVDVAADGFYQIRLPTTSFYDLTPTCRANSRCSVGYTFTPTMATVPSGQVKNFVITPGPSAMRQIMGRVTFGGAPVAGATVTYRSVSNRTLPAAGSPAVVTNANGEFTMLIYASEDGQLLFTKTGYGFDPFNVFRRCNDEGGLEIEATSGPGLVIRGRVIESDGTPFAAPTVIRGGALGDRTTLTSGADTGTFSYIGIQPGTNYTLTPEYDGFEFTPSVAQGTMGQADVDITFTAREKLYTLSGRVTLGANGLGGVTLDLYDDILGQVVRSTTSAASTGNYSFTNVPHGFYYHIVPRLAPYTFTPSQGPAQGSALATQNATYNFAASTQPITGTVSTNTGTPLSGITLTNSCGGTVTTNASGFYSVTVPAGQTQCTLTPQSTVYDFAPPSATKTPGQTQDFIGTPKAGAPITGQVRDNNGNPLPNITITNSCGASVVTNGTGNYSVSTLATQQSCTLTPQSTVYDFAPQSSTKTPGQTQDFIGTPKAGAPITGQVRDNNGTALSNITITNSCGASVITNGTGNYSVSTLATQQSCTLTPQSTVYDFAPQSATKLPGQTQDFIGTPKAGAPITGRVTDNSGAALPNITITNSCGASVVTNGSGNYSVPTLATQQSCTLTPQSTVYDFAPQSATKTPGQTQDFIGTPKSAGTITGNVRTNTGTNLSGITLTNSCGGSVTTNASGFYTVTVPGGQTQCTLTPQSTVYDFAPQSATKQPGQTQDFIGTPKAGAPITGQVRDNNGAPLPNITITNSCGASVVTNGSGNYSVPTLVTQQSCTLTPQSTVYDFAPQSATKTPGQTQDFIGTPKAGAPITGQVRDNNGNPLASITITNTCGASVVTNGTGHYSVSTLATQQSCTLTPQSTVYDFAPQSATKTPGQTQDFIGTPKAGAPITGQVRDNNGNSLPNITITNSCGASVVTNGTGNYSVPTLATQQSCTLTPQSTLYDFAPQSATKLPGQTQDFIGTPKAGAPITGQVRDNNGNPLPNITITNSCGASVVTNGTGNYSVSTLATQQSCTLTPQSTVYDFAPQSATKTPGQTQDFIGTPKAGAPITGQVRDNNGAALANITITNSCGASVVTNGSGYYSVPTLATQQSCTLTPQSTVYDFAPQSATKQPGQSQNFVGTPKTAGTITGNVRTNTGTNLSGITLTNSCGASVTTNASGFYSVTVPAGQTQCTLTPQSSVYDFAPTSATKQPGQTQDFIGTPKAGPAITGQVRDNNGNPLSNITITNSCGASVVTNGSGYYSVPTLVTQQSCTLTPQSTVYDFAPQSATKTPGQTQDFVGTPKAGAPITGQVRDNNGNPIPNITITNSCGASVVTNGAGAFSVPTLATQQSCTLTPQSTVYDFAPQSATKTPGQTQDFVGTPKAGAPITGSVRDNNGNPLPNITITNSCGASVVTNGTGNYSVPTLATQQSCILTPQSTVYDFVPQSATKLPGQTQDFVGTPKAGAPITGQVRDNNGTPLPNITIANSCGASVVTNGAGAFSIPTLATQQSCTLTPQSIVYDFAPQSATKTPGQTQDFIGTPKAGAPITGQVRDNNGAPLPNITITNSCGASVVTNGSGNYSVPTLATQQSCALTPQSTTYDFAPQSATKTPGQTQDFVGTPKVGPAITGQARDNNSNPLPNITITNSCGGTVTTNASGFYSVTVPAGQTQCTLTPQSTVYDFAPQSATKQPGQTQDFIGTSKAGAPITGQVRDNNGTPLPNITIANSCGASIVTNGSGGYSVPTLATQQSCTLTPQSTVYDFAPQSATKTPGQTQDFIGTPKAGAPITGQVRDNNGAPLPNITITNSCGASVVTNGSGAYSVSTLATQQSCTLTPQSTAYDFAPQSATKTPGQAQDFIGTPKVGPAITGQIRDNNGNPLPNITITNSCGGSVTTNGSGSYSVTVPAGQTQCTLTPQSTVYDFSPPSATKQPGQTQDFTGTPKAGPAITGKVTDNNGNPLPNITITNSCGASVVTNGTGNYSVPTLATQQSCTLTPQSTAHDFTPPSATKQPGQTQDFVGTPKNVGQTFDATIIVTLANLARDPLGDVEVKLLDSTGTVVRTGKTGTGGASNGIATFAGLPNGNYNVQVAKEGFTIVPDSGASTAPISQTNPSREYRATPTLKSPIYTVWNSYLRQANILELVNTSADPLQAEVFFYLYNGELAVRDVVDIPAFGQRDRIVNDYKGYSPDSYGMIKVVFSHNKFDGRLSFYREDPTRKNFEFAFFMPFVSSLKGTSYVLFNTYQPSENPKERNRIVPNWLQVTSLQAVGESHFSVNYYDLTGKLILSKRLSVPSFARRDIQGGHIDPGPGRIGMIELVPDNANGEYLAQIFRYGTSLEIGGNFTPENPERYDWAFPLVAKPASGRVQQVPISTMGNANNWLELANTLNTPTNVILDFYSASGSLLGTRDISLPAKGQNHFFVNTLLPKDQTGTVQIRPRANDSVVAQSMFYLFNTQTRSIAAMYGSQSIEAFGREQCGTYNLFLGQYNWLKLLNNRDQATSVTLSVRGFDRTEKRIQYTVPRYGDTLIPLHQFSAFNTQPDTYGTFCIESSVEGSISSELLRLRIDDKGEVDYASPTLVR